MQIILSRLYKIVSEVSNGIDWHNLPQSIIHGDLSSDNAIFNVESGNITFIDFDNIRVSNRIWDIARLAAVIGLLYDNQLEQKQLNIEFAYDKVNTLLAGYTQNVVLNPLEKNNLTNIIIINLILAFLSEFDIDDLENTIFTPVAASVEFEKLLAMTSSLKQNLCRVLT
ncbi:MAG: phosphotransferase [Rickettsia hoogstraalii]